MSDDTGKAGAKFLILFLLFSAVSLGLFMDFLLEEPHTPVVNAFLWGHKNDSRIRRFHIKINQQVLANINFTLKQHRIISNQIETDKEAGSEFKKIINYWMYNYKWGDRERYLNTYPNYKTTISGLDIHFVHVVPNTNKTTVPLLMLHGWPGTFRDYYEMISLISKDDLHDIDFELVVPSLVGCGFSDAPLQKRLGSPEQAVIFYNLMQRLGYKKFYVYGVDLGSLIVTDMVTLFPNNILGLYSPFCLSLRRISVAKYFLESTIPDTIIPGSYKSKYTPLKLLNIILKESAYLHVYTTKPQSLGFYLKESPIILARFILDIISSVTFPRIKSCDICRYLNSYYSYEHMIDTLMLHIVTETQLSSAHTYNDVVTSMNTLYQIPIKKVPCSCPRFRNAIFYQSQWILKDKYKNLLPTKVSNGNHYFLLESNKTFLNEHKNDIFISIEEMIRLKKQ